MPPETEKTIDIDNSGNAVALELAGHAFVSVHIRADATAEYKWDVRKRGGPWIEDAGTTYSGSADHDDDVETAAHEVRIRCSSGTGGNGDQSTITLMTGG